MEGGAEDVSEAWRTVWRERKRLGRRKSDVGA